MLISLFRLRNGNLRTGANERFTRIGILYRESNQSNNVHRECYLGPSHKVHNTNNLSAKSKYA